MPKVIWITMIVGKIAQILVARWLARQEKREHLEDALRIAARFNRKVE